MLLYSLFDESLCATPVNLASRLAGDLVDNDLGTTFATVVALVWFSAVTFEGIEVSGCNVS